MVCYRQQLTIWPGKLISCKKNTSKMAILVCTNLSYLILEGPGRQTVDTRSTSGVPLKTLGYSASNQLCGRSVAPKLSTHEPATFFQCVYTEIREKVIFRLIQFQTSGTKIGGVTLIRNGLFTPRQMSKRGSTSAGRKDPLHPFPIQILNRLDMRIHHVP